MPQSLPPTAATTSKLTAGQVKALDYITRSPLLVGQQGRAAMCKSAEALLVRGLACKVEVDFYGEPKTAYIAVEAVIEGAALPPVQDEMVL